MNITIEIAKKLPPSIILGLGKTWTNSLTTDRRVAQNTLPCRMDCTRHPSDIDSLDHYINCEKLHPPANKVIRDITGIDLPRTALQNLAIPNDAVPKLNPIILAGEFNAHFILDAYQMIAGRQRKGTIKNPPPVADIIKDAFRKLNDMTPWAHHVIKKKERRN